MMSIAANGKHSSISCYALSKPCYSVRISLNLWTKTMTPAAYGKHSSTAGVDMEFQYCEFLVDMMHSNRRMASRDDDIALCTETNWFRN